MTSWNENMINEVYDACMYIARKNLVFGTYGNVSCINREKQIIAISPSCIPYDILSPDKIVIIDRYGNKKYGNIEPSSDMETHICLYDKFSKINSIVHTHSLYATAFAQSGMPVTCFGTTHADFFCGDIPCTNFLEKNEYNTENYKKIIGKKIIELFNNKDYMGIPSALVAGHGAFSWGISCIEAVDNSYVLEQVCKLAFMTKILNPNVKSIDFKLISIHSHQMRKKHTGG